MGFSFRRNRRKKEELGKTLKQEKKEIGVSTSPMRESRGFLQSGERGGEGELNFDLSLPDTLKREKKRGKSELGSIRCNI